MSNLLASFSTSSNALDVFQQALNVIQNNVNNSSTPGYAKQSLNLEAQPLDVAAGLLGGVSANGLNDSRDQYIEEQVQQQSQALGQYTMQAQNTGAIQSHFDMSGASGVSGALSNLLQSFSAWSASPSDPTAQQSVLNSANTFAQSVQALSTTLNQTSVSIDGQIGSTVSQINTIAGQIQQYNAQRLQTGKDDPGAQAQLYSSLDSLSQLVNFSTVKQSDGTVSVLLAEGSPLVLGKQEYALSSNSSVNSSPPPVNPQSPPTAHILDSQGADITGEITSGQLGGLLDTRNRVLGSILGDAQQQGSLNQFAQGVADTVNSILQSGTVSTATGAAHGTALFTYSGADATAVAGSLQLNPAVTTSQLAPVDSSGNANGNANALADLENPTGSLGQIGGYSMVQFFGNIAASVGQENQTATTNLQAQQQVVAHTTSLRDQTSGVSLDQEAANVLVFQRAYQASAQVLNVMNTMVDSVLNLIPPA